jgi:hypothetical protein
MKSPLNNLTIWQPSVIYNWISKSHNYNLNVNKKVRNLHHKKKSISLPTQSVYIDQWMDLSLKISTCIYTYVLPMKSRQVHNEPNISFLNVLMLKVTEPWPHQVKSWTVVSYLAPYKNDRGENTHILVHFSRKLIPPVINEMMNRVVMTSYKFATCTSIWLWAHLTKTTYINFPSYVSGIIYNPCILTCSSKFSQ